MSAKKHIIICGGGAAGFFTAINIAEKQLAYKITILEKSKNVLSKVRVSGGGRCNVTNERSNPAELVKFYPRGGKKLYAMFQQFSSDDMQMWLQKRGVKTKSEADLRVFPVTDSSETIIDCFLKLIKKYNIKLLLQEGMENFEHENNKWIIKTTKDNNLSADILILATGSAPSVWNKLRQMQIAIEPPVPSLFTFNINDQRLTNLQGISFENVEIKVAGTKLKEEGPMLITHWGLSGPAVLKVSAWGARELFDLAYNFEILINFLPGQNYDQVREIIQNYIDQHPKRKILNNPSANIPKRYWEQICIYAGISETSIFGDLGKKSINKLTEELSQAKFRISGKSTFKEEFVTCGGVALSEVDLKTMQSRDYSNLFFTGEMLDIDAVTGGFNFQSCWSSAWLISKAIGDLNV